MMLPNEPVDSRALKYAMVWHSGTNRKYTGEPYICHPIRVSAIVSVYTEDPEVRAAAYLHDVLEDCDVTEHDVGGQFGDRVRSMVVALSNMYKGSRAERHRLYNEQLAASPAEVQTIKLADTLDNVDRIAVFDSRVAATQIAEKIECLGVALTKGHSDLWCRVLRRILGQQKIVAENSKRVR